MKAKTKVNKKSSAQAIVEFAIAAPVLLAILYGVLETGRFLFLYSTVVTASRQAARYGSATGNGNDGEARYKDCDGIRAAASRAAYLGPFDSIVLQHDTGPGTTPTTYCSGSPLPTVDTSSWNPSSDNEHPDRIVVTVTEQFRPIVPKLVPFVQRNITATSARTIIKSVSIVVQDTGGGGGGGGGSGILGLVISTNPASYGPPNAGQTITIFYSVTNLGNADLTTPITITTDRGSWSCAGEPATLAANGGNYTCSGTYVLTQADMDAAAMTITAIASAAGETANDTETIFGTQSPALTLTKVSDIEASAIPNTVITYTYTLTNSGNVSLGPPYSITDDKIANNSITCPAGGTIASGASITCTGTYTIKNPDIANKSIVNNATATAYFAGVPVTSNTATWTVYTPALYLTITVTPTTVTTVGQIISYEYNLKNISANDLKAPYAVADSLVSNETCPAGPATLIPGASVICTGTHTVTQAELDAGTALTNTIVATADKASGGGGTETSNTVTKTVTVTQTGALSLAVSAAPNPATTLGSVVTYTYTLTNSGNVTLSPTYSITDDKATFGSCASPAATLAPGATKTCTGTRTLTQTDLDNGSVTNTAIASAAFGSGTVTSSPASATVTTFSGSRLTLLISANPSTYTAAGQNISFTYVLRNTGDVTLTAPYSVTSALAGSGDCSAAAASIPSGGSTTCTGIYTTVGTDVTNGTFEETASASAFDGSSTIFSAPSSVVVYLQGVATWTPTATSTPLPTATSTPTPTATLTPTSTPCASVGTTTLTKGTITSGGLVTLSWTAATNATSYEVHRSTTSGFAPSGATLLTTISSPTLTYNAALGSSSATYYFRVVPKDSCSSGGASNQVSVTKFKISGTLTKDGSVTSTLTMSNVTITGSSASGRVLCTNSSGTSYSCDVIDVSGTATVTIGAYYGSPGNSPNNNNKTCGSAASPSGTVFNNDSSSETTAYAFSSVVADVTFNITIARHDDLPPPNNCTATQ